MGLFKKLFGKPEQKPAEPVPPPPPLPPQPEPLQINEISSQDLHKWLQGDEPVTVLDLRQTWEYESGHISQAINIPIMTIPDNLTAIPQDQKVVLQCYHGYTSLDVAGFLLENGWADEQVYSLTGGMSGWAAEFGLDSLVRQETVSD